MDSFRLDIGQSLQANSGCWYRNLQVLGTGGNAATHLVVATSGPNKGVPFAAKVFRRLSKPERRESFLKEFQFLRTCNHPSIMRVLDEGIFYDVHPFLIAEYLPNTLNKVIRAGTSSLTSKVSFTLQLLSALSYLSSLDPPVIHRDIKPENIFVKGFSCVLGDFGLMKHAQSNVEDDLSAFKESLGAGMPFRYRTPDLVAYLTNGTTPTPKSDVFQLGLVVAELFTGKNPLRFSPSDDPFSAPIELNPLVRIPGALSAGIANLISRMLELDPQSREAAAKFLDPWLGVFSDASIRSHALEGRIFS
jgi:serine/threonine protein kinase